MKNESTAKSLKLELAEDTEVRRGAASGGEWSGDGYNIRIGPNTHGRIHGVRLLFLLAAGGKGTTEVQVSIRPGEFRKILSLIATYPGAASLLHPRDSDPPESGIELLAEAIADSLRSERRTDDE